MPSGRPNVALVGAGPGDPGLLTLRAAHLLATADVLLYDALVDEAIVMLAPAECERVFVGKRGGNHAMPQEQIEALMIREGLLQKRVVRLKGGDPFVFGRGAEEAEALHAAGIAFEIVPGISSALAAPAYAGIPLTHRQYNAAFTVATGHEDPAKPESTLDWPKLADPHRTLVFLMAAGNLDAIARRLIAAGLEASTPAAVVQDGTRPTQRTVVGRLETIAGDVARAGMGSPAVVIIGEVVRSRDALRWFDRAPLFGKRVLITRAADRCADFAAALRACGAVPIVAPLIATSPPDDLSAAHRAIDDLGLFAWLTFTSSNGVDAFFQRLRTLGADARYVGRVGVAAIGPKTAQRLERHGVRADLVPAEFVGEDIARALIEASQPGDRMLIYGAQDVRDVVPNMLADAGRMPVVVAAYRTTSVCDPSFADKLQAADIVTFASASSVRGFSDALGDACIEAARTKTVACIGPITASAAGDAGLQVDVVAETFTTDGLIEALEVYFGSRP